MDSQVIHCQVAVDWSVRQQEYVEDCQVCCRPIVLTVRVDEDGETHIEARSESD